MVENAAWMLPRVGETRTALARRLGVPISARRLAGYGVVVFATADGRIVVVYAQGRVVAVQGGYRLLVAQGDAAIDLFLRRPSALMQPEVGGVPYLLLADDSWLLARRTFPECYARTVMAAESASQLAVHRRRAVSRPCALPR